MTPCNPAEGYKRFGLIYCFHLQYWIVNRASKQQLTACSSETPVNFYKIIQCHIPEGLTDSCWLLGLLFDLWGCTFLRKVGFTFRNIVSALHRRHVPGSDNVYEDVNDKSLNPSCWFVPRTKLHRTGTPLNDICFPISYADLKQFMYIFIICTTNIQLLALSCVPQPVLSSIYRHYRFI